jgi:hypothetical protein
MREVIGNIEAKERGCASVKLYFTKTGRRD